MRALILAAGRGSRLAPLTDEKPKCLAELGGMTLLDRQVRTLNSMGVSDITVLVGYMGESIAAQGIPTITNADYADSNMVYTLFCARRLMLDYTDLVVSYGDIVYEPGVLGALLDCDSPMCVAVDHEWRRYWSLRMEDPLTDAETMKLDEAGMITELGKKPGSYADIQGQYIGLFKVRRDFVRALGQAFDALEDGALYDGRTPKQMYMTSFIQYLIDDGWPVRAVPISNGWLEFDTYAELQLYRKMQTEGTLKSYYQA